MRRVAFATAVLAILGAVEPADGYRLRSRVIWFPTSSDAERWQESDFPLRFRMLENDNLPARRGNPPGGVDRHRGAGAGPLDRDLHGPD